MIPYGPILRILGPLLLVLGLVWFVYGKGKASVQAEWDAERALIAAAQQRDSLRRMEANHGVGIDYRKRAEAAAVDAALARADADRVRGELANRAANPGTGFGPDESAATASALGECIGEYQALGTVADGLTTTLGGLQNYVRAVCLAPAEPAK